MNTTSSFSSAEQQVASVVASLASLVTTNNMKPSQQNMTSLGDSKKRASVNQDTQKDSPDTAGGIFRNQKKQRTNVLCLSPGRIADNNTKARPTMKLQAPAKKDPVESQALRPAPFFYYKDYSTMKDPDCFVPLTPPGRVPNFLAKMHAILARDDLTNIVSWMPHGRSWKIWKPREFEIRVIPTYFEHTKFSSFVRQANGWGFRRITKDSTISHNNPTAMEPSLNDRNSYYHPMFLRAMPHLCKHMKRPGVSMKVSVNPDHEPDLHRISEIHPVPEKMSFNGSSKNNGPHMDVDALLLRCTLEGGPKARMPICATSLSSRSPLPLGCLYNTPEEPSAPTADHTARPLDNPINNTRHNNPGQITQSTTFASPAPMPAPPQHQQVDFVQAFQAALSLAEQQYPKIFPSKDDSKPPALAQMPQYTPPPPHSQHSNNNSLISSTATHSSHNLLMAALAANAMKDNSTFSPLAIANQWAFPSISNTNNTQSGMTDSFAAGFAAALQQQHEILSDQLKQHEQQQQQQGK